MSSRAGVFPTGNTLNTNHKISGELSAKGSLETLPSLNNGKAGYLMLTASADSDEDSGVNREEVVATEERSALRPDGRRLQFPARGLVRLGRQVWKSLRRRRFLRFPAGLRRAFSRNDLTDEAPAATEVGVRTRNDALDGDERDGTISVYRDDPAVDRSSRLVNALVIDEPHTSCGSEFSVGANDMGVSKATGNDARDSRLQVSSYDMFWDIEERAPSRVGERHVNSDINVQLPSSDTEDAPLPPPLPPRLPSHLPPRVPPRVPPRLPSRLPSSLDPSVPTPRLPYHGIVHQAWAESLLNLDVADDKSVSPVKPNQHRSRGRETSQKWSGHDPLNYRELIRHGWYWGPLKREEANEKLTGQPMGTFLIRDCSDDRHLYAISFVSPYQEVKHALISYNRGKWSFYREMLGCESSLVQLVERSILKGAQGIPSLTWNHGSTVLTKPLSRFHTVRSLQHHCRFVVRLQCRIDLIPKLPLPSGLKEYLKNDIM